MQSVQSLLVGLTPHLPVSSNSDDHPTVIHVRPKPVDPLGMRAQNHATCTALRKLYSTLREPQTTRTGTCFEAYKKAASYLEERMQSLFPSQISLEVYFDSLRSRDCQGFPLPCRKDGEACISNELRDAIFKMGAFWIRNEYHLRNKTHEESEEIRLRAGPLFSEIRERLLSHSSLRKKVFVYSAHDTTLAGALSFLEASLEGWPPYASSLLIELWHSANDGERIHIIYNGKPLSTFCVDAGNGCNALEFLKNLEERDFNFHQDCK
jgi:hypothetical protein